ncbi:MAG: Holliday junction resolvase RuvX [Gammaproteobacteria bacterium]|nr:Holliday junction resolvase RuvX [Gammaproteobacteria bacterium]
MPVLVFDFGMKFIGVAVAEPRAGTATALTTIKALAGRPQWHALDTIHADWRPEAMIVGLPLNMDDSESKMSNAARRFGRQLEARFALPVHFADERLTTFEAKQRVSQRVSQPGSRRQRRGDRAGVKDVHAAAAQIIAETWLSELNADS